MKEIAFILLAFFTIILPIGALLSLTNSMADISTPTGVISIGVVVVPTQVTVSGNPTPVPITEGNVTDVQRYLLAVGAGFAGQAAIIATAISFAEDGSGNPAALSPINSDGSRDLGLWQINSGWWPRFGGYDALIVPANNAAAAFSIYNRQGWCAWSTYGDYATCHYNGHNNAYLQFIPRAQAAAAASGG